MKIEKLFLKSFRGIENQEFIFAGKNIIFFGINGSGKSSVLQAINLLFSPIINKVVGNRFKQGINIDVNDITYGASKCEVSFELSLKNNIFPYQRSITRKDKLRSQEKKQLEDLCHFFQKNFCLEEITNMPIFINYGIHRLVLDIPLRIRNKHEFDKLSAFEKSIYSTIDFRTFFEWFRYQEDLENQLKVEKQDWNYMDKALTFTRKAITAMLEGTSHLRVDRHPLAMKVDKNGTSFNVDQLSDGEKCTLALLGDLTRRLVLANPSLENPLLGVGIVLIDEIELHMHPSWQRKIVCVLQEIFPNIQFIITTHSPQILGEISQNFKLYGLRNEEKFEVKEYSRLDGWDSNDILEILMETSHMNEQTKEDIVEIFNLIRLKEFQIAEEKLKQISNRVNENNFDIISAFSLIQLGRRKNDSY